MTRLLLAACFLPASAAFAAMDIGVAAAVRGKVAAVAPGAAGRLVETGQPVYQNDRIRTGAGAKLQILLLDETSFTIGPDSEMTLDEFVYDPATSAGKVSAKVAKGSFRFITGKVARKDPESMKVKLSVGTIGIRGTMVAGKTDDKEATVVLLGPGPDNNADERGGAITVGNEKGSVEVEQDGYGVTLKAGERPGEPFKLPPGELEDILSGVASAPKGASSEEAGPESASASEASGDETASGKGNLEDAFSALDDDQDDAAQFASQQFSAPRTSKWDDVRGILGGTARYLGSATFYSCSGSGCTTPAGTASLDLYIDFANRTFGGNGSNLALGSVATGTIYSKSYADLGGDAKYDFVNSVDIFGISTSGDWSGTRLSLQDAGGQTAATATVEIKYRDLLTETKYEGEVTGTR